MSRPVAAVAAGLLLMTAPAAASPEPDQRETVRADTTIGGYLAALHASTWHDYGTAAELLLDALKLAPDAPVLLQRGHDALLLDGRVEEAADLAVRAAALDVELRHGGLTLTVDALQRDDADTAAALAASLPLTGINRLAAPLLQAWTLADTDQPDAAAAALASLGDVRGAEPLYHLHAALIADVSGNTSEAAETYAVAVAATEQPSLRAVQLAGNFYGRTGRRDEAEALYRTYLDHRPDSAIAAEALARIEQGGDPPAPIVGDAADGAAEALFGVASAVSSDNTRQTALVVAQLGLALKPDFPMLQILTANLLEELDRYADANEVYARIAPESPLRWESRISVAANLDRLDRFEEAEPLLRRLASERADNPQPLLELGDLLRRRERFREAVDAYDAAFERIDEAAPQLWRMHYARGIALERAKMWERAEADFLRALELEPGQPFVLNYLGYSWVDQGVNLERALDMIRDAVEARPRDGFMTDSLGWAHYKLGNYDEAVEHLERAVLLQPEDPVINDHLGDAYWRVGRRREARFRWRAALELDPEPELQAAIEEKLENGLAAAEPAPKTTQNE